MARCCTPSTASATSLRARERHVPLPRSATFLARLAGVPAGGSVPVLAVRLPELERIAWRRGIRAARLAAAIATLGGDAGWLVQRLCARLPQRAFCFSRLYAARLREEGLRGELTMLAGVYDGPLEAHEVREPDPVIVFAGRHIPEKQVPAILPAFVRARERIPQLRATILGDGPERAEVIRLVGELDLDGAVEVPGFVPSERVDEDIARALCMLLPSRREGYGLVVIEAAASGTPSVVVAGPDNAAVELVSEGENGFIAESAAPQSIPSPPSGPTWPRPSSASTTPDRPCATRPPHGSHATPSACRSRPRSRSPSPSTVTPSARARRRRACPPPSLPS